MKIKHALCIPLLTAFLLAGCSQHRNSTKSIVNSLTATEETLLTITNGESFEAVTNILGIAARHEFTVSETDGVYTFISCYFDGGDDALWLLFHNQRLAKVIEPFSFPELLETYAYEGTTATRIKSWDIDDPGIEERVEKVIDAHWLTRERIAEQLRSDATALSELSEETIPDEDYIEDANLFERYNGNRATIGIGTNEIERLYGKPIRIIAANHGVVARIYGTKRSLNWVNPQLTFRGLAVISDAQGRVTAIYSDQFFCESWKN
jgi:hypothetical protein